MALEFWRYNFFEGVCDDSPIITLTKPGILIPKLNPEMIPDGYPFLMSVQSITNESNRGIIVTGCGTNIQYRINCNGNLTEIMEQKRTIIVGNLPVELYAPKNRFNLDGLLVRKI
jgi:hypothetical protein